MPAPQPNDSSLSRQFARSFAWTALFLHQQRQMYLRFVAMRLEIQRLPVEADGLEWIPGRVAHETHEAERRC